MRIAFTFMILAGSAELLLHGPLCFENGLGTAFYNGVLVRGDGPLEKLSRAKKVVFNKTGTLTKGEPDIVDMIPAEGYRSAQLLEMAAKAEYLSDHRIAACIRKGARTQLSCKSAAVILCGNRHAAVLYRTVFYTCAYLLTHKASRKRSTVGSYSTRKSADFTASYFGYKIVCRNQTSDRYCVAQKNGYQVSQTHSGNDIQQCRETIGEHSEDGG